MMPLKGGKAQDRTHLERLASGGRGTPPNIKAREKEGGHRGGHFRKLGLSLDLVQKGLCVIVGRRCWGASNSCGQGGDVTWASGKIVEPRDRACGAACQGSGPLELYPTVSFELGYGEIRDIHPIIMAQKHQLQTDFRGMTVL